jgi:hypothetical protein
MLTLEEIAAIPKPKTWADYVECYTANLDEARSKLERARQRFQAIRRAGNITEKPDGGFIYADKNAKNVHGDVIRWQSDLEHWHRRKTEAEKEMRAESVRAGDLQPLEEAPF